MSFAGAVSDSELFRPIEFPVRNAERRFRRGLLALGEAIRIAGKGRMAELIEEETGVPVGVVKTLITRLVVLSKDLEHHLGGDGVTS